MKALHSKCGGTGYIDEVYRGTCQKCGGRNKQCKRCGSYGVTTQIRKVKCSGCRGTGYINY